MTDKRMVEKRWGILNPYGKLWTPNSFQSESEAAKYLDRFWGATPVPDGFKVVPVIVTIEEATP